MAKEQAQYLNVIDSERKRFVIVTTNYDELLEQAFQEVGVKDFHVFSYIADGDEKERGKFFPQELP